MSRVNSAHETGFSPAQNTDRAAFSSSPCQSTLPNDSACYEVSVEAAGSKAVGGRGPAGQDTCGRLRGRSRLGGLGEKHLAGIARQSEQLERQVEVADDQVVDELDAGAVDLDVGGGPPDTNSSLPVDSSPMRSERRRS
jgi:hypothetical protein